MNIFLICRRPITNNFKKIYIVFLKKSMDNLNLTYIDNWFIKFGKYKGLQFKDLIDRNYITWLLDNQIIKNTNITKYLNNKINS